MKSLCGGQEHQDSAQVWKALFSWIDHQLSECVLGL